MKSPVICIHGFPGIPAHWDTFAAALPDDCSVYSVPMPWLRGSGVPITSFADILTYIAETTNAANIGPAHFVGHDLGGVALFWLAQSGLRHAMKSVTIIAAPHPETYSAFMTPDRYARTAGYIDTILASQNDADLCTTLSASVTGTDLAILPDISAGLDATDFSALRSLYGEIRRTTAGAVLHVSGNLDCPVAVIHSINDRRLPADLMAASTARFGPRTKAFTLDGDSHYPHLTASRRVAECAREFWNAAET